MRGFVSVQRLYASLILDLTPLFRFGPDPLSNIPAVNVLTTVMQANIDIGNQMLETGGVFEHLMAMAQSGNLDAQVGRHTRSEPCLLLP